MKRRDFAKITALSAVALSTTGFIRFNGESFVGDCETTTDILGPFYRPDSPVRNNLVIKGAPGDLVELKGTVRHKDCISPYKGAKVELWHCSSDEVYDNDSEEFRYRGTTFCDDKGNYNFISQMPVPYNAGGGRYRPAHFHILISAPGYQSLVTQLYFSGDPYLEKDISSASPKAKSRILDVKKGANGKNVVSFDITMTDKLRVETGVIDKLLGTYLEEKSEAGKIELFKKDNQLWKKNEVYGMNFEYIGNNTFEYPGSPQGFLYRLQFEIMKTGVTKLTQTILRDGDPQITVAMKKK